jgi:hypothetical protein
MNYTVQPLSDEMEKRIRARIETLKSLYHPLARTVEGMALQTAGAITALEWVLHEAEIIHLT